ncbi:hypothetical protein AAFC00_006678 [Neodothiora populina]|uniref:Vacuolar fusion protein MON1 n=1 Tax=Neodothiora populina TaxID=2781224 RepID=A0ABR3PAT3_9PEZI
MPGAPGEQQENAAATIGPKESETDRASSPHDDVSASPGVKGDTDVSVDNIELSRELTPPPLPPRSMNHDLLDDRRSQTGSLRLPKRASRPQLQARPTTAVSLADVETRNYHDRSLSAVQPAAARTLSGREYRFDVSRRPSRVGSDNDASSVMSPSQSGFFGDEVESLMGDVLSGQATPAWRALTAQLEDDNPFERSLPDDEIFSIRMHHEFDPLEDFKADASNEEYVMNEWKAKLKHFFILSSSGKPIWSRHGDDQTISNHVGIIQTIISFYQNADDPLRGFTAGDARFVILSKGHLNLVAISRLGESDGQLRSQLEALYMQILSTLTLPNMERMFSSRPSTDLRRPLQGTEVLLGALADGFTRGSIPTLFSALECLRLRKSQRSVINTSLLKVRSPNLLYGLIVAGGQLVSVVRPKKHSLHPGDLHLIFNMLFEAGAVKAAGGENWIPLCLPGFNNTGYLYMYVSFLSVADTSAKVEERPTSSGDKGDEIAIILISTNKEAFFELRQMRDDLIDLLNANGSMAIVKAAVRRGHPTCNELIPGTVLRHFVYKSRGNVQYAMPSFAPHFQDLVSRRRLVSLYHTLHASIHTRNAHLKVQHCVSYDSISLAWETPVFELYCVAGPHASREALAQGANRIIKWIRREEERVFIIGGAVF